MSFFWGGGRKVKKAKARARGTYSALTSEGKERVFLLEEGDHLGRERTGRDDEVERLRICCRSFVAAGKPTGKKERDETKTISSRPSPSSSVGALFVSLPFSLPPA